MARFVDDGSRTYIAIDLKSFFASCECAARGLDPLTTNLVVADVSKTEKTICLAVSPSLKSLGISGRARLFEVVSKVRDVNRQRRRNAPGRTFSGTSVDETELKSDPSLELYYIAAPPRMHLYLETSSKIYGIYLKYVAPEDMHVYSIDEVFIDATPYLKTYGLTAHELARKMIADVLKQTGITATAGIGPNLYLCKIAMDVVAKHIPADKDGVRIAELDTLGYRRQLWNHRPLTDFWRVGRATERKLEKAGLYTMGDIARCSLGGPGEYYSEDLLYDMFGVSAELLIDHAWGWEPCTFADIRAYRPGNHSISSGQVLLSPYDFEHGEVIIREMAEKLSLELLSKKQVTDQIVLDVGYDVENVKDPATRARLKGRIVKDRYGREVPRHAHGSENLGMQTASAGRIIDAAVSIYEKITDRQLSIRRFNLAANHTVPESSVKKAEAEYEQMDFFRDFGLGTEEAGTCAGRPKTREPEDGTGRSKTGEPGDGTGRSKTGEPEDGAGRSKTGEPGDGTGRPKTGGSEDGAGRRKAAPGYVRTEKLRPDMSEREKLERERRMQEAILEIKTRFGKNAVVRGTSFEEGATGRRRNEQIGGHKE